eukprot:8718066-Pyramimonas_sp.AAC.1
MRRQGLRRARGTLFLDLRRSGTLARAIEARSIVGAASAARVSEQRRALRPGAPGPRRSSKARATARLSQHQYAPSMCRPRHASRFNGRKSAFRGPARNSAPRRPCAPSIETPLK